MQTNRDIRHRVVASISGASLLLAATALLAGPPTNFQSAFTADSRDAQSERAVFSPSTPKIYVIYMLADSHKGDKIKIAWIAEKVEGADPNTKMGEKEAVMQAGTFTGVNSFPKPQNGWPSGTYRIELFVDGKLDKTLKFQVTK